MFVCRISLHRLKQASKITLACLLSHAWEQKSYLISEFYRGIYFTWNLFCYILVLVLIFVLLIFGDGENYAFSK